MKGKGRGTKREFFEAGGAESRALPGLLGFGFFDFALRTSHFALLIPLLLLPSRALGQKPSDLSPVPLLERAEGERQARLLVADLLAQKPAQNYTNTQVIRIRAKGDVWQEVPVRLALVCTATNFASIYEILSSTNGPGGTTLTIIHADGQPIEYWLGDAAGGAGARPTQRKLPAGELTLPFAGSDFWACDLGLEFLHWPQQRVLKKEMRQTMNCNVLESTNPNPAPGNYSRVVTWIAINRPGETVVVHADAYDSRNQLLKSFDPKKVEKVNGAYQLAEMGMRNLQTGSRTRIEFDLEH
jgi:hypothetical protein